MDSFVKYRGQGNLENLDSERNEEFRECCTLWKNTLDRFRRLLFFFRDRKEMKYRSNNRKKKLLFERKTEFYEFYGR